MKYIESVKNPKVKAWKKLLTKKERDVTGKYLIEGFHLVEEALKEQIVLEVIVNQDMEMPAHFKIEGTEVVYVKDDVMKAICDTETPQGIAAVCEQQTVGMKDIKFGKTVIVGSSARSGKSGYDDSYS